MHLRHRVGTLSEHHLIGRRKDEPILWRRYRNVDPTGDSSGILGNITGWWMLVVYLPLGKMMDFVSWDDDIPNSQYMEK